MHDGRVSGWGTPGRDAYSILVECGSWSEIKSMGQGWEKKIQSTTAQYLNYVALCLYVEAASWKSEMGWMPAQDRWFD